MTLRMLSKRRSSSFLVQKLDFVLEMSNFDIVLMIAAYFYI